MGPLHFFVVDSYVCAYEPIVESDRTGVIASFKGSWENRVLLGRRANLEAFAGMKRISALYRHIRPR
jgi:hypothetical protein